MVYSWMRPPSPSCLRIAEAREVWRGRLGEARAADLAPGNLVGEAEAHRGLFV
jgi:hypothetical protein